MLKELIALLLLAMLSSHFNCKELASSSNVEEPKQTFLSRRISKPAENTASKYVYIHGYAVDMNILSFVSRVSMIKNDYLILCLISFWL